MRIRTWSAALIAVALTATSCSENGIVNPGKSVPGRVRLDLTGSSATVVISQVYGGGGNASAPFKNDFIELHNRSSARVSLEGWSVQYTSSGGAFSAANITTLSGFIEPGQFLLVQEAPGANGAAPALPTPNFSGLIAMALGAGKVALVNNTLATNTTPLPCSGGAPTCTSSALVDFVGYGTANGFEGSAPTAATSNTRSARRLGTGCQDFNENVTDFEIVAPAPRNDASPAVTCEVVAPGDLDHIVVTGGTSVNVGSEITLSAELQDADNHTIDDPSATFAWESADDATVHIVSTTGKTATIRGMQLGGPVAITLTATSNAVTKTAAPTVTVTGVATIVPSTTVVSEIHYDNTGVDVGEAIEIEGDAGASIQGWSLVLYDGTGGKTYNTTPLTGTIPATCDSRGVVVIRFPDTPSGTIQNGSPDGWALVNAQGQVTEFKSYEGTFTAGSGPAAGLTSTAIDADESTAPVVGRSVQRAGNGVWFGPRTNTFGVCNPALPLGPQGSVTVTSGKTELAFAMQTQFFFGGTNLTGQPVTSVVWSTSNAAVIIVDQHGVVTGKGIGSAQLIATAPDGAIGTVDMTVYLAAGSTGIRLGHNTEFGEPRDADPSDDFLIRRAQYTVSYNPRRGGANWVSWNLDASHIGDNGRCPGTCYSADTALSNAGLTAYTTADWVSNVNNIVGYDRGHMAPSADWTSSEADNNTTFFLSNFLPQRADLNQGPWEVLENALRDSVSASHGSREAYIIAGGVFTNGVGLGTLLDLGKVGIPDSTWKIAVITPAGAGLKADGTLPSNTTVMAVNMPNIQGIKGNDWHAYLTTVAKIEKSTGYNFLALIAESVQCRVEQRNCAPTAHITSGIGGQTNEGQTVAFSGATSTDPDQGDVLNMVWTVNGANVGTGETLTYNFAQDGSYTIRLIVSDNLGAADTTIATINVSNVAPAISMLPAATLLPGETYSADGSFSDPGADPWTATVNYGDGAGNETLVLSGKTFVLSHTYLAAGLFTVTVRVSDDDVASSRTQFVTVIAPTQALSQASDMITDLARKAGMNSGNANSLNSKIDAAQAQLGNGNTNPAANQLRALLNELDAMIRSGRVTAADAAPLRAMVTRVIQSISIGPT